MKIVHSLFLSLLSIAISSPAQNSSETSMLWEISGNGLTKSSYLFGTFHAICDDKIIKENKELTDRVANSEQLCFEIDIDQKGKMLTMMKASFIKTDERLNTLLNEEDYSYLNRFFVDSMDMDLEKFNRLKPMLLSGLVLSKSLPCKPLSMEEEIMKLVKKKKRVVVGLETIEEQMAVFDNISLPKQAEMLVESAKDFTNSKVELKKMYDMYASNDLDKLYSLFIQTPDMKGMEGALLNDRNNKWLPNIERMIKEKSTFIAVGAAHLPGEQGVISGLRKAGYMVTPITNNN